jgi:predicted esterase
MTDTPREPLLRHVNATVHGRVLVRAPEPAGSAPWLVGFHGYAQSSAVFMEPLARAASSPRWLVASVEALHPFYSSRDNAVVANWMTRQDRELAIADNVAYVNHVLDQLEREFGEPRLLVFAGFSQGVAMAYRAAILGRRSCAAIVAVGGDTPPELTTGAARLWPRVLIATGTADTWYTIAKLEADAAFIAGSGGEVGTFVFEGGHEWGDAVVGEVGALLAELEGELG